MEGNAAASRELPEGEVDDEAGVVGGRNREHLRAERSQSFSGVEVVEAEPGDEPTISTGVPDFSPSVTVSSACRN